MSAQLAPGTAYPLGATPLDGGVNFSVYANKAEAIELLLFDHVDDAAPAQVFRLDSGAAPHLSLLARVCAGSAAGPDLRLPRHRPQRARARACATTRTRCCLTPTVAPWPCLPATAGQPPPARRQRRHRHEERRGRQQRLRLGGRSAAAPLFRSHGDLRDARRAASPAIPTRVWRRNAAAPTPG